MNDYDGPTWTPKTWWQRLLFRKGDGGWYWTRRAEAFYRLGAWLHRG
ncbi:MAG TPA: hypothetical protein VJQ57_13915 [Acidimicrobiia bacterium]|nr:hypothetical protein [Acidimicrobiia bacterium]